MVSWAEFAAAEPDLASAVADRLTAHRHHTLATLRRDGSPRVSGIEVELGGGELWLGMMAGSRKALDLRRDPRLALHTGSDDPPEGDPAGWPGDAKISGVGVEEPASDPEAGHRFRVDLREVSFVRVDPPGDHLVVDSWVVGRGRRRDVRR